MALSSILRGIFQSTPPAKAETNKKDDCELKDYISIHSTREGGDWSIAPSSKGCSYFNPLHPRRRRQQPGTAEQQQVVISIHSTREGGDMLDAQTAATSSISIHSTREGGDFIGLLFVNPYLYFNPLHPRRRRLSTSRLFTLCVNFNPLHPRRRRLAVVIFPSSTPNFNPLHPRRRRRTILLVIFSSIYFNPLHPRRRRQAITMSTVLMRGFQSTPPAKAETKYRRCRAKYIRFQSTPPAKAETFSTSRLFTLCVNFNPLHPRRRRPQYRLFGHTDFNFNPLHPRRRRHPY